MVIINLWRQRATRRRLDALLPHSLPTPSRLLLVWTQSKIVMKVIVAHWEKSRMGIVQKTIGTVWTYGEGIMNHFFRSVDLTVLGMKI